MLQILLLSALTAFPWVYSHIEAKQHLKRIIANGSKQGGMHKFHRQALVYRAVWLFGFGGIIGAIWLWHTGAFPWVLLAGWLCYAWPVFGYNFTRRLNWIRHEVFPDYGISAWYVSRMYNAAWTDRMLVHYAELLLTTPEKLAQRIYTVSVFLGIGLYAFAVWINSW